MWQREPRAAHFDTALYHLRDDVLYQGAQLLSFALVSIRWFRRLCSQPLRGVQELTGIISPIIMCSAWPIFAAFESQEAKRGAGFSPLLLAW